MRNPTRIGVALGASALLAAATVGSVSAQDELTPIDLQLQWFAQAQFGGFYAAKDLGFYEAQGLDVTINETPSDQAPQVAGLRAGRPRVHHRLGAPRARGPRVRGAVGPGQHRPALPALGHALGLLGRTPPVTSPEEFAGKKVGVWDFGNEYEVIAAGRAAGLEPGEDYERIIQNFDMNALPQPRDRRRRGDDLQRVRPGARDREPRDGRAVPARGHDRHRLQRRRHRHAPGRHLGARVAGSPRRATRTSPRASSPPASRAGCTAATTPMSASRSWPTTVPSSAPATRPG